MSLAVKFDLKGVVEDTDRHGNVRLYFRAPSRSKIRLRETPGSTEFHEEVRCAREGIPYAPFGMPAKVVQLSLKAYQIRKSSLALPGILQTGGR